MLPYKYHRPGGLRIRIYFSHFWNMRSPQLRCQPIGPQSGLLFCLADDHLLAVPSHGINRREENSLVFLFIRALTPSWGPTFINSPKPNYLPKSPCLNTITLEVRDWTCNFWGSEQHRSVQNNVRKSLIFRWLH